MTNILSFSFSHLELIDTLWNVNKYGYLMFDKATGELIDTLWNVNRYSLCGCSRAG